MRVNVELLDEASICRTLRANSQSTNNGLILTVFVFKCFQESVHNHLAIGVRMPNGDSEDR
jgi:hypothetical protein